MMLHYSSMLFHALSWMIIRFWAWWVVTLNSVRMWSYREDAICIEVTYIRENEQTARLYFAEQTFYIKRTVFIEVSYNQPKLCPSATWYPNASTDVDSTAMGSQPYSIFVDTNNTLYAAARSLSNVKIWFKTSTTADKLISTGLYYPGAVFATSNGDVYVDNGFNNSRVDKWTPNATTPVVAMYIPDSCYGLHVDLFDNIYCSIDKFHYVIKSSLNGSANNSIVVAGTGVNGSSSTMLCTPRGIFVDRLFNFYVADCGNNRIQYFTSGNLTGTTVAGVTAAGTISLQCPTGVALDGGGYLFIVDGENHRVVGQSSNGFRCVVGCTNTSGSASNQLSFPRSLSFDSYGNIYVVDRSNDRVQKFSLQNNTCGEFFEGKLRAMPRKVWANVFCWGWSCL